MVTTNSGFEKVVISLLTYTPFQEYFGKATIFLGIKEIVSIFTFWSLVIFIINLILSKLIPSKLIINTSLFFFLLSTMLHLVVIIRQFEVRGILSTIIALYILSLVAWFFYKQVNKFAFLLTDWLKK